ncbi:MAG: Ku protein [Mesorhizobium sp.]|nr:MAG: Ku protein [Mesorhizobium sp.]
MAPRASWKGYLKLSLVSCPVRLYPATSASERISFNQLHKDTHNRINMKPVDPELGLVERSDLVKGYEYEDKQYIIIDDADLEAVRIESNHTMNIEAFVDERSVDVIYQDAPYYLAPDGAMAEETFAEALIKQKETTFDPKNYEDRYEIALMAMIREKLKGHKPIIAAAPERGNVINLMDALKASLSQSAKPPAKSKSKADEAAKPAAKTARAGAGAAKENPLKANLLKAVGKSKG